MYNDRGNIDSIKNKGIFLVNGFYYYINKDGYIEKYSGELKVIFFSDCDADKILFCKT